MEKLEKFKIAVDILASLSAIVAIVSAMTSWYRSARRPLKIVRTVIHKKNDKATFILVVKNVKPHPVVIRRTDCYRRKKYEVQKKHGGKPEYSELFPVSERIFDSKEIFEIAANGHTDIRISDVSWSDIPAKLLFLLETSHGYHELWCKELMIVEIGKAEVYSLEYTHDFESKWRAKVVYYWKRLKELTRRST
ncbi:MAG TPA: hypothetical protein VF200_06190 [Woeseiaceae bacterium]